MFDSFLGSVFLAAPPVVEEGVPRLREEHTQADIVQECVLPRNLWHKSDAFESLQCTSTSNQNRSAKKGQQTSVHCSKVETAVGGPNFL